VGAGSPPSPSTAGRVGQEHKARRLEGVRFHDLRHSGNTLAASSGVSTRDLMARMGHDSMQAAIIYQHATTEADARIAAALDAALSGGDDQAADETGPDDDGEAGAAGALVPGGR
jgi:integrase